MRYNRISEWKYEIYGDDDTFLGTLVSHETNTWLYRILLTGVFHLTDSEMRRIYNKLKLLNKK